MLHVAPASVEPAVARLLPENMARECGVLLLAAQDDVVTVACAETLTPATLARIERATGRRVQEQLVPAHVLLPEILRTYGAAQTTETVDGEEASVADIVDALIRTAVLERATDLHLEQHDGTIFVRLRIDGVLKLHDRLMPPFAARVMSRMKLLAGMDIGERRLPQDGRHTISFEHRRIDVRIASIPTHHGERLALRFFDRNAAGLSLAELGMSLDDLSTLRSLLQARSGFILVCGPTNSGKTTTLYAALEAMDPTQRHICTVEDPIERVMRGITQVQVHTKAGLTFGAALRALLRQDPDALMIGEIRDRETAETALHAALSGQLVLASVHGADAFSALERMQELGVAIGPLAGALSAVLTQRLLRRSCVACCGTSRETIAGVSCDHCAGSGFRGRFALFDMQIIESDMRRRLVVGNRTEYRTASIDALLRSGRKAVAEHLTTAAELARIFPVIGEHVGKC